MQKYTKENVFPPGALSEKDRDMIMRSEPIMNSQNSPVTNKSPIHVDPVV